MPTTTVNTFDTIEEWRLKTNELGVKIADLDNNLFTINVIASGNITASGNINALGNVVVTNDARVTGNIFGSSNLVITGNVLAANVLANVHYGTYVTSKPAINVLFNGNILGSSNLLISNSGTNIITISANVANDSVTLGTHTIGNYVKEITSADTSNIIVNNGVGEGTTPTVNLAMTNVTPGVYANANTVASFTVSRDGRLTAASNVLIDRAYILTTGKPSVNLNFTGDVTGKANVNLSAENTNTLDVALTIQPNSVALGADTTGNYVENLVQGSGITLTGATPAEGGTPTISANVTSVGTFVGDVSNTNLLSSILQVDGAGSQLDADLLDGQQGTHYLDWANQTNKPAINLTFTGDVTGSGGVLLTNTNTNNLSIGLTVAANSVALGNDTTGEYVANLVQGAGITLSGLTGEGATPTISANVTSVGSFVGTVSNTNLLSSILQVDGAGTGLDADLLDGQQGTYYLDWANQTNKPAINVLFNANITGSANVLLTNSGTNILTISANVANDSVTLGTHTIGDFVKSVNGTTGRITSSVTSGENAATVIDLATIAGLASTQGAGNANLIPAITYDQYGRITGHSNVAIDRAYGLITNKPSINLRFTGNIVGNANLTISSEGTNFLEVQANLKTLPSGTYPTGLTPGTYGAAEKTVSVKVDDVGRIISIQEQTITGVPITGDYVKTVVGGTSITVTGSSNPVANVVTVNHGDTSSLSGSQGGSGISGITVDDNGHVTGVTTATYLTSVPVITLGTGTAGNYTDRVVPGTMMTVSGTSDEGNVITINHSDTSSLNGLQGGTGVASITVDDRGHVTAVSTATYLTSVPVITLGSGTDGNYTNRVVPGTMITVSGTGDEGNVITVNHSDTSTLNGVQGGAGIASITVDDRGHVTAVTTATYCTSVPASSNVFSYFGAGANTISQTNSTLSAINSTGFNFFAGVCTGQAITTGTQNIFFGECAGRCNQTGSDNFFAGRCAGVNSTSNDNILIGSCAGRNLTAQGRNIFLGSCAGAGAASASGGTDNFGGGAFALRDLISGCLNTAVGYGAGLRNTTGSNNIFIGSCAGCDNTSGSRNLYAAFQGNITTGNDNIIFGCLTSCVGLTSNTSNVILMATGGIRRLEIQPGANLCVTSNGVTLNGAAIGASLTTQKNFIVVDACSLTSTGCHNTFIGQNAGRCTTFGKYNIFVGRCAGFYNTTGRYNNFFGFSAGRDNTTACHNFFVGALSGAYNTTGNNNTFFGRRAGQCNTTGCYNTFIGAYAGYANTTGSCNIYNGLCAGYCNTSGFRNIFLGHCSGFKNTTGSSNFFAGAYAGCGNTTGTYNTFIGFAAGASNTIGTRNIFIGGQYPGYFNTTGDNNIFLGQLAGCSNTTGSKNIFMGPGAGFCNTTGNYNIFFGNDSGRYSATGTNNTFLGNQTGYRSTTANYNNFLGAQAGFYNTSGSHNNFLGTNAGYCNTSGNYNNVFGRWAGYRNTTGCNNVFIGHFAGCCNTTGSNNLFFGCNAGVTLGCTSTESNRIVMGNSSHTLACIQIAWTTPSDIRDKCIFGPVPHGKSFLGKINPITFSFKNRETNELKETKKRYGFSAQEVLEAEGSDPVIVGTDNPEKLGFTTDFIIPILVNAVKELTKDVEDLRAEIAELKKSR